MSEFGDPVVGRDADHDEEGRGDAAANVNVKRIDAGKQIVKQVPLHDLETKTLWDRRIS